MVDGTRSGRVARGKAGKPPTAANENAKGAKPQGVTKTKARPAPRRDAKAPSKGRGKAMKTAAAVTAVADADAVDTTELQITGAASAATSTERQPTALAPPPTPKVTRVYNDVWASTIASTTFIAEPTLTTTDDTNTITLNLIDHIIKPENWNPDLSYNVLSATCFFFASVMTGQYRNTPERIASAMKVDLHMIEAMAGPQVHYNPLVKARLAEALRVGDDDVVKGYGILWEQREGLRGFVGEYAGALEGLSEPGELAMMKMMSDMGSKEGEGLGSGKGGIVNPTKAEDTLYPEAEQAEGIVSEEVLPSDEAAIEAEKASEVELDPSELDDFDRYVEENE